MRGDGRGKRAARPVVGRLAFPQQRRTGQRGAVTVEFVLLTPLLLVTLFLIFEFGRVFGSWLIVTNAAREGARVGITQNFSCNTCTTENSTISGRVAATAQFLTIQTTTACSGTGNNQMPAGQTSCVGVSRATNANGEGMLTVTTLYSVQTLMPINGRVPFLGQINYPGALQVAGLTTMRAE